MKQFLSICFFLQLIVYIPWSFAGDIRVTHSWVREAPPTLRVSVAYMIIENHSTQAQKLISVSSDDFHQIELHQTINKEGMMQMEEQSELNIPASSQIELKPSGYHLMMMGRNRSLQAGDRVTLSLLFANGRKIPVEVPVLKQAPEK